MSCTYPRCDCPVAFPEGHRVSEDTECPRCSRGSGETIEEQRRVEGFGDPQYTCSETELAIRIAIYTFLQQRRAAGELTDLSMTQDWSGNTLHLTGVLRPRDLARAVAEALRHE